MFDDTVLQVFCKAPVPGRVKTRLQPQLTASEAAAVYRRLVLDTLGKVCNLTFSSIQVWCAPNTDHPFFRELAARFAIELRSQSTGDLGERMDFAVRAGLSDYPQVILIGSDIASLQPADLEQAVAGLRAANDVVIAPAEDGGYALIGMKSPCSKLFRGIAWSSATVMTQTSQKLREANLTWRELRQQWDVDTYSDFLRLNTGDPEILN